MAMEGVAATTSGSLPVTLFLLLCILAAALFYSSQKAPRRWPLLGFLPSLIYNYKDFYEWITRALIQSGGTITHLKGPWTNWVVTADPANVEYILKIGFHNFVKGDYFVQVFCDVFGVASVFLQDGETWKRLRATVSTIFASPSFRSDVIQTTFMLVHRRLIPLFQRAAREGSVLDLDDVFHRYSFDSVCNFGLGCDPGSLALDLPRVPFAEAYDRSINTSMRRFLVPAFYWKALRFLNLGTERQMVKDRKIIDDFARQICAMKMQQNSSPDSAEGKPYRPPGVLPLFLRLEKENHGRVYSADELRDICVNIIMAGRDTTAPALSWFFWLLQQHPRVEDNILLELKGIIKRRSKDENDPADPEPFTFDELKEMHYLHAALSESMRLYPSAPIEISEVANDDVLPDGTKLKKGSKVMCLFYSMGRMETIWGADCREFKPERWLKNGKFMAKSEFVYPVFNEGPRRCAGREVAYLQMKWLTSSIIVRYRVKAAVQGQVVVPKFGMMLITQRGLKVTVCPRSTGVAHSTSGETIPALGNTVHENRLSPPAGYISPVLTSSCSPTKTTYTANRARQFLTAAKISVPEAVSSIKPRLIPSRRAAVVKSHNSASFPHSYSNIE